jgi:biopolymer transport protein ExbB/TolQ
MTDPSSLAETLWASLWGENSLPGRVLILLMTVLTLQAAMRARHHLARLGREQLAVTLVMQRLAAWRAGLQPATGGDRVAGEEPAAAAATAGQHEAGPPPSDPDPAARASAGPTSAAGPLPTAAEPAGAPPAAEAPTLSTGVAADSLIAIRLGAIAKMRAHQVRINPATLQQMSRAREAAQPGIAAAGDCASLVMMLGLLGTFIGLAIMVQRIHYALPTESVNVSVDSWSGAFRNVAGVLSGVKTAFSASLVGMVCAILCTLLHRRVKAAQLGLFERLERVTAEDILPAMVPATADESLLERVTHQLETSFAHLDAIFQQSREALGEMTGAQEAFVHIVDEIRLITKNESSRDLERVVEQLAATNRAVLQVVEQVPAVAAAIERGQRQVASQLGAARAAGRPGTSSLWWLAPVAALLAAVLWRILTH